MTKTQFAGILGTRGKGRLRFRLGVGDNAQAEVERLARIFNRDHLSGEVDVLFTGL
ncbi:MAG TPA: hypothetical protein VH640_27310 [Bryobacteraceae bacterium]|jgi:hypothetical protein